MIHLQKRIENVLEVLTILSQSFVDLIHSEHKVDFFLLVESDPVLNFVHENAWVCYRRTDMKTRSRLRQDLDLILDC